MNMPMAPSSRIQAMNLIGDLMRRVGVSLILFKYLFIYLPCSCTFLSMHVFLKLNPQIKKIVHTIIERRTRVIY